MFAGSTGMTPEMMTAVEERAVVYQQLSVEFLRQNFFFFLRIQGKMILIGMINTGHH